MPKVFINNESALTIKLALSPGANIAKPSSNPPLNEGLVKGTGTFLPWVTELKIISDENFLMAIKLSIHYFEEYEEFEKCAFLKKIQNVVEENLEK
jgi:hypothetical protein